MLQKLFIKNYVLIDSIELSFDAGLNIITGETGAGKSILLGALGLILGDRAESNSLYDKEKKCVVEGVFLRNENSDTSFFSMHDLDESNPVIVRRELGVNGTSRAFINDTPVSLQVLRQLTEQLVDVHAQHETTFLNRSSFQLQVVDTFANTLGLLKKYQAKYQQYLSLQKQIEVSQNKLEQAIKEKDFIQYQWQELKEANVQDANEQETIELQLKQLENVDLINQKILESKSIIESESGLLEGLNLLENSMSVLGNLDSENASIHERVKSLQVELQDILYELQKKDQYEEIDEEKIQEYHERLDVLYRLQKKHKVNTLDGIISLQLEFENQLASMQQFDTDIENLKIECKNVKQELEKDAKELNEKRSKVLENLSSSITKNLHLLNMKEASFHIQLQSLDELQSWGKDEVKFTFSANAGQELQEIKKVASGGELSRLMLCIKNLIAEQVELPTLVFDEIDTGISGETAMRVGSLLESLSEKKQVITITHLPQIASRNGLHMYVYKNNGNKSSQTFIMTLDAEQRVVEIAKMLSGEEPSEKSMLAAKELITKK